MAANYGSIDVMKHCIKYSWGFLIPPDLFDKDYINKENHPIIFKLHNITEEIYQNEFGEKWINEILENVNCFVKSDAIIDVQLNQIDYLRNTIKKAILDKPNNKFDYAANNMLNEYLKRLGPLEYAIKNYRDNNLPDDFLVINEARFNKIALGIEIINQFCIDKNINPLINLFYSELDVIEYDINYYTKQSQIETNEETKELLANYALTTRLLFTSILTILWG